MPWSGTVRGRVGYVANQWLLYATGGLAYGRVEVESSAMASGLQFPGPPCQSDFGPCPLWNFSNGVTKIGWTVGGGAELALDGDWAAKIEYLFVDLGSFSTTFAGLPGGFGVVVSTGGEVQHYGGGHRDNPQQDNRQHRATINSTDLITASANSSAVARRFTPTGPLLQYVQFATAKKHCSFWDHRAPVGPT
jgi:opacity protein-like surface antigen